MESLPTEGYIRPGPGGEPLIGMCRDSRDGRPLNSGRAACIGDFGGSPHVTRVALADMMAALWILRATNKMGKPIQQITVKSIDRDIVEISADGWDGLVWKMSRLAFENHTFDRPVIYALYTDHFEKGQGEAKIYIGHTDDIATRLRDHDRDKDFWTVAVIFSSKSDWMNSAVTQNVEYAFIQWAGEANRYKVENGNLGSKTHLGVSDKKLLTDFLDGARDVLRLAGIDIFQLNLDGVYTLEKKWGRESAICRLKINSLAPLKVRILAGSELFKFGTDDATMRAAGARLSDTPQVWRFDADADVPVVTTGPIPSILGNHSTRCLSRSKVALSHVLNAHIP